MYVIYSALGDGKLVWFENREKLIAWMDEFGQELEGDLPFAEMDKNLQKFGVIGIITPGEPVELTGHLYFRSGNR